MTKRWLIRLILGCLLLSLPAHAQTFEDGYQSYVRNQFPVAELQFKSALRKSNADEDRAVLLKFIGICQYMRGDKKNSHASFVQALTADRSIVIEAEEVLDPSVQSFFNNIKARVGPELKKKPKPSPQPLAVASKNNSQAESAAPSRAKSKVKKPAKVKGSDSIMGLADSNIVVEDRSKKLSVMQFLPLGLPQFYNGSYWLGSGVAGLQLFTLYSVMDADKTIKDRESLNDLVENKEGLTDEQRESFYSENNSFINKVKGQKNLALAAFGTIWVASIAESIFLHRTPNKSASLPAAPAQSISPIVQAHRNGGTFGLSWKTELK